MPSLFDRIKAPVLVVFISLLLLFLFTKIFGPIPFRVQSINTDKSELFTADGKGEATGTPDTAQFTVGVTKNGNNVDDTQKQANITVNKVIAGLKEMGIDEKDIKTQDYNVNPNVDFSTGKEVTNGYTVSTTLVVTVKDATKASNAVDGATKNGANIINGVSFTLNEDEKKKLEDKARLAAIKDAKEKAQKISNQAGIRLGKVINIVVDPTEPQPVMFDRAAGNSEAVPSDTTQLQSGENKVTINVTLYYETL